MDEQTVHLIPQPPLTKVVLLVFAIFATAALYFHFAGPIPLSITSIVTNKAELFTVTGEGKVITIPDTATINLGIISKQLTVKAAQQETNLAIKKIQEDLKALNIEDNNIKTTNYQVNPTYDWTTGKGKIIGYEVTANLSVKIKDFEKINSVIDAATADGANLVNNLNFSVDDDKLKELKSKAREEAIKEAQNKAQELAKISGLRLGRLVDVQESDAPSSSRPYSLDMMKTAPESGGASTSITPGEQEITSSVTLSYETL